MLPFRSGPIGFLGTNIRRMLNRIVVGTKHKPSRGGSNVARMHGTVRVRVYSTWSGVHAMPCIRAPTEANKNRAGPQKTGNVYSLCLSENQPNGRLLHHYNRR